SCGGDTCTAPNPLGPRTLVHSDAIDAQGHWKRWTTASRGPGLASALASAAGTDRSIGTRTADPASSAAAAVMSLRWRIRTPREVESETSCASPVKDSRKLQQSLQPCKEPHQSRATDGPNKRDGPPRNRLPMARVRDSRREGF